MRCEQKKSAVYAVKQSDTFCIYGAQVVAYGAYVAIKGLCGRRPEAFLVSSMEGNPGEIDGVPVRTPEGMDRDALVIVAVTELLQGEITAHLRELGCTNVLVLTQEEEHRLMGAYFARIGRFELA